MGWLMRSCAAAGYPCGHGSPCSAPLAPSWAPKHSCVPRSTTATLTLVSILPPLYLPRGLDADMVLGTTGWSTLIFAGTALFSIYYPTLLVPSS
jgi:hypothetical protein